MRDNNVPDVGRLKAEAAHLRYRRLVRPELRSVERSEEVRQPFARAAHVLSAIASIDQNKAGIRFDQQTVAHQMRR
jgi:hypothetical protein